MSIIIKGLDLPPVSDTNGIINLSIDCYGQVVVSNTYPTKILKAEQIPKGRLIDADAVQDTVLRLIEDGWDITRGDYKRMDSILFECPTIIEAEEIESNDE